MKSQIIQYILSLFNDSATRKIAGEIGEDHSKVQNALESIIPTIMRGFASKTAEGSEQVNNLLGLATSATSSSWFQSTANWFTGSGWLEKGEEILNNLFGNKNVDRIAANVAQQQGMKSSSAFTLMQWAAPLCLGALGKYIGEGKMDATGLATWLSKEKLDLDSTPPKTVNLSGGVPPRSTHQPEQKGKSRMWIPILLLLLAAALIWFLMKGCNGRTETITMGTDTLTIKVPEVAPVTLPSIPSFTLDEDSTLSYVYGDTTEVKLPDGTIIRIPSNGAEAQLISNIKTVLEKGIDASEEGKKAGWINLYDVQFSKMLTYRKGAQNQINNIAMILKAYPTIHIKIGGYTDNTGSDEINQKLSQQRAEQVTKDLGNLGVAKQLEKAEGYGSQFAVGDNATGQGRAQNRRVSCRIVSVQ